MGLNSKYRLKEKYYLFGIIGLIIIFLSKFISFTKLLINCSILKIGDLSDHIPEIYFLAKYGYLNIVPDWYNGFRLFEAYPPGWSFFVYPFYYLFNNLEAAVYIACILLYAIGFSAIFILG
ncbi:MAG: hypothetical protein KKA79_08175, partial [Nanoarchaeota archaeon]|nr:hypothetical protein [Nanoarchaeota archaeon]